MLNFLDRVYSGIAGHWRERWPEWGLAGCSLSQGIITLNEADLPRLPAYKLLTGMVPAQVLGIAALLIGAMWLIALVLNGTFAPFARVSPWVRSMTAMLASANWVLWSVAIRVQIAGKFSPSFALYYTLAALAIMSSIMSASDVGHADERARKCRKSPKRG